MSNDCNFTPESWIWILKKQKLFLKSCGVVLQHETCLLTANYNWHKILSPASNHFVSLDGTNRVWQINTLKNSLMLTDIVRRSQKILKIYSILSSALIQIQDNQWPWRLMMSGYDEWLLSYVIMNVRRMDLPCVQFPGHFNLLLSSHSVNHWMTNVWPNAYWNKVVVLVLWTDDSDNNTINTSETNIVVY